MVTNTQTSKSAAIRARLNHPVIDSDGHMIEFEPAVVDFLGQVGGSTLVERFKAWGQEGMFRWYRQSPEERMATRTPRKAWWGIPTKNTLDRATAALPGLLYNRLEELGLDFAVLYPTFGLSVPHIDDEEMRRGACRAFNEFYAATCSEFSDRLTPAALIPMHTPQEAIEELEHAAKLGLKATMCAGFVRRPLQAAAKEFPGSERYSTWIDTYGLDSVYDYDPFWAKCVELKISPSFHSSGQGWGSRTSPSNYMYNHIGMFATASEALCKSLFMGGVPKRFPALKFAFLEGGVGWACSLYADLIGHWDKRNIKKLDDLNPAHLNRDLLLDLYKRYGGKMIEGKLDQLDKGSATLNSQREDPATLDEWAACKIERAEDIRDMFISSFYFGCEADDPLNAWAFNTKVNPLGGRLKILFGSDIGHWDVPDIVEVVEEAYELVEDEVITDTDLKDFVFTNPVSFYAGINRDFFKGTAIEDEVGKLISGAAKERVQGGQQ